MCVRCDLKISKSGYDGRRAGTVKRLVGRRATMKKVVPNLRGRVAGREEGGGGMGGSSVAGVKEAAIRGGKRGMKTEGGGGVVHGRNGSKGR